MTDFRFAFRQLLKSPGFSAVAILTLALGIGATTAIFSVVNGLMLKPLPYGQPDQLVAVFDRFDEKGWTKGNLAPPGFRDWRAQNTVFEEMAAFRGGGFNWVEGGLPQRLRALRVTAEFFDLLRSPALIGRTFQAGEDTSEANPVVVLSYGFWQRHFGGTPDALGKTLRLDGRSHEIIGVMAPSFRFGGPELDLWSPLVFGPDDLSDEQRHAHSLRAIARLKPGVTVDEAAEGMRNLALRIAEKYPEMKGWSATVIPLHDEVLGTTRLPLLMLLGAVVLVLLIACANVANLLLARAASREREFAVRAALGAGRARLIRQMLSESFLLAGLGTALGIGLSVWFLSLFKILGAGQIAQLDLVTLDLRVLGFTAGLSLLTGLAFGLAPAWCAAQTHVNEALKDSARGSTEGGRRRRLRAVLVVVEVGLAVVLLTGAGLLIRSFAEVNAVDPGFRTDRALTGLLSLPDSRYPNDAAKGSFMMRVAERLAEVPGVEFAGITMGLPLGISRSEITLDIEGQPKLSPNQPNSAGYNQVTPDYFPALGIGILSGRNFDRRDGTNAPFVALVNEAFVRTFFQDGQAIGQRMKVGDAFDTNLTEIVGIVRDVRHLDVVKPPMPEMYFPMAQRCWGLGQLAVRVHGNPEALSEAVRRAVGELDGEQPVHGLRPMESLVDDSLATRRFQTLILAAFAVAALLLAAVGIYGVMAYGVSQRTHEIGVRMSLGAESHQVLRMILGQGMRMAGLGIALGLVGAWALTRIIQGLLYEVSPRDPLTFILIPFVLLIVAAFACLLPALRASRIDPMVALRAE